MDRWKAEQGRGREKRKIRRKKSRRERVRRNKMQMREKVGKSRNTVCFQWFEARLVEMSKKCTPLWREAHFQVKMYKANQLRTTFWSCDVEKVHAVVARSTFWSQNVQNTPCSDHFWKLTLEKVHAVVAGSTFRSQNVQSTKCSRHFWSLEVQMSFRVAGARDCAPCQKWPKREGFVAFPRMMAGMGHLKRICKDAFSWQAQYKRHVHERC